MLDLMRVGREHAVTNPADCEADGQPQQVEHQPVHQECSDNEGRGGKQIILQLFDKPLTESFLVVMDMNLPEQHALVHQAMHDVFREGADQERGDKSAQNLQLFHRRNLKGC